MASPDEKRYPTNYWNLVGVVVFIWISFYVAVVRALPDDTRGETATGMFFLFRLNFLKYFFTSIHSVQFSSYTQSVFKRKT